MQQESLLSKVMSPKYMNTELATITAIASNDKVKKSDAVIWFEGDGMSRMDEVMRVYNAGLADYIVVSGGLDREPHSIPAPKMAEKLYEKDYPKEKVIVEDVSQNTYDQGVEIMKLVKQSNWSSIILVASHYHQLRAYLTFLQAMKNAGLKISMYNSPARDLPWFTKVTDTNRKELFEAELEKIEEYGKKGHVASIADALEYQAWKEAQS